MGRHIQALFRVSRYSVAYSENMASSSDVRGVSAVLSRLTCSDITCNCMEPFGTFLNRGGLLPRDKRSSRLPEHLLSSFFLRRLDERNVQSIKPLLVNGAGARSIFATSQEESL